MKKLMFVSALTLAIASVQPALADRDHKRSYERDRYSYDYRDHRGEYRHRRDEGYHSRHHRYDHPGKRPHHSYHRGHAYGKYHKYHYQRDHRHIVYHERDDDYYKWVGGALVLSEIIHHADRH